MTEEQHKSNFWFGFILGGIAAGSASYLFGTKKGRKILKNLLDMSENLEENIASIIEELGEEFEGKKDELLAEVKKMPEKKQFSSLQGILNKMKNFTPKSASKEKKLFIKDST